MSTSVVFLWAFYYFVAVTRPSVRLFLEVPVTYPSVGLLLKVPTVCEYLSLNNWEGKCDFILYMKSISLSLLKDTGPIPSPLSMIMLLDMLFHQTKAVWADQPSEISESPTHLHVREPRTHRVTFVFMAVFLFSFFGSKKIVPITQGYLKKIILL